MRSFKHLTFRQRLQLEAMQKQNYSVRQMASELGVHVSTIYRELKRGDYVRDLGDFRMDHRYSPDIAERKYRENRTACGPDLKIGHHHDLARWIETLIVKAKYSPAAVCALMPTAGFGVTLCRQTLYKYLEDGVFFTARSSHLPQGKRKQRRSAPRKVRLPHGRSIELRPPEVAGRSEFGHWEMDTVCGPSGSKPRLLVLTERLSRYELIFKLRSGEARGVVSVLDRLERKLGKSFSQVFRSITVDNGSEFSFVVGMERSLVSPGSFRTIVYHCHPYCSSERGSNENANKLIRRWFPKGTDFGSVRASDVQFVQDWINSYPRKIFAYSPSQAVFSRFFAFNT